MVVVEFDHGLVLASPSEGYVRSPGLHASTLYGSLYRDLEPAKYDKRLPDGTPVPMDMTKMEVGTAFEEVLEPVLAARLLGSRPGEFFADHDEECPDPIDLEEGQICPHCAAGIAYSPDYVFDIDGELVLGEFKCSGYSYRDCPTDQRFGMWISQISLYLHWLKLTRCRLYVMFLHGNYKPASPVLKAYELTFSVQELREEYLVILQHAKKKGLLV